MLHHFSWNLHVPHLMYSIWSSSTEAGCQGMFILQCHHCVVIGVDLWRTCHGVSWCPQFSVSQHFTTLERLLKVGKGSL